MDDILIVSKSMNKVMEGIDQKFHVNPEIIGPPLTYLGAQIYQHNLAGGRQAWEIISKKYIKNVIKTVEYILDEGGDDLK